MPATFPRQKHYKTTPEITEPNIDDITVPLQPRSQARRIIDKFGGPRALAAAMNAVDPENPITRSTVYKWLYTKEKGGTGGRVPGCTMARVMKAAKLEGVFLTDEDFYPGLK